MVISSFNSERELRDGVMRFLFSRIGINDSWRGLGKKASFNLKPEIGSYTCYAEKTLSYSLPTGYKLTHKSDILIIEEEKKIVSIELKYKSSVPDQFKSRSYAMLHLKQTYGDYLLGIIIWIRPTGKITLDRAENICYPFDHFFGIELNKINRLPIWDKIISTIETFLRQE